MLEFSDLPYEFVPFKPQPLMMALARTVNRIIALPGKNHRLTGIDLTGVEALVEARRETGARFVLVPNHPTHSDPQVVTEICRRAGIAPAFMAAYDVFARGKLKAWIMQQAGAFSVDREGSDRKSMKCAADILAAGRYPLVIFPEGNVYLCNDRVGAFNEGAAYLALRAQKDLGTEAPVYVVPISLKYTFVEDVRDEVRNALAEVGRRFETEFDANAPITDEINRISLTAMGRYLKQRGHSSPEGELDADSLINHAAEQIIESLESKIELSARPSADLSDRIRKIRAAIHAVRTDPDREVDHPAAAHWADEAMLALRILGYAGRYAAENPTLDRVAETVTRLEEDVTSKLNPPFGKRRVLAEIGKPIDLREHLETFASKARRGVESVTTLCEATCQEGIDRMNAGNKHPGAEKF